MCLTASCWSVCPLSYMHVIAHNMHTSIFNKEINEKAKKGETPSVMKVISRKDNIMWEWYAYRCIIPLSPDALSSVPKFQQLRDTLGKRKNTRRITSPHKSSKVHRTHNPIWIESSKKSEVLPSELVCFKHPFATRYHSIALKCWASSSLSSCSDIHVLLFVDLSHSQRIPTSMKQEPIPSRTESSMMMKTNKSSYVASIWLPT